MVLWTVDAAAAKSFIARKLEEDVRTYLILFKSVSVLRHKSRAEHLRIIDAMRELEYSAGAVIINKNSKDDENFYLIHDGEVKLTELTSELTEPTSDASPGARSTGPRRRSRRLRVGDTFGASAFTSAQLRAYTATALTRTLVLVLDRVSSQQLLGPIMSDNIRHV
mmetsp:Transcript_57838/g.125553  ORF Transcript_57838/g.125553 Transcript_57838/m.125553 type:complete len:166 (-) Transcript_57838:275-772(-)